MQISLTHQETYWLWFVIFKELVIQAPVVLRIYQALGVFGAQMGIKTFLYQVLRPMQNLVMFGPAVPA